jgi:hypothetical protein
VGGLGSLDVAFQRGGVFLDVATGGIAECGWVEQVSCASMPSRR